MNTNRVILTANPEFSALALDELADVTRPREWISLAPGVLLVTLAVDFFQLVARFQSQPPIFIRHLCPEETSTVLTGTEADLELIQQAVLDDMVARVDPTEPLSVQTRIFAEVPYKPFDLNTTLATALHEATGVPIDVRHPQQILSVVCADATESALIGLSTPQENLSDWAGGMRRFAREPQQISRAEFKLLEALETFRLDLPPNGVALDLGAAPGGWTRVLRTRHQYVTAVDPAELDPRVAVDRYVRHRRMTAEQYLLSEPDTFDLIVNDMRLDARDSARLMVRYAEHLYPHGHVIMTLKLPESPPRTLIDHALAILRQAYDVVGVRQLFHNRSEITVCLRLPA